MSAENVSLSTLRRIPSLAKAACLLVRFWPKADIYSCAAHVRL
jgi:hypothetical protein